MGAGGASTETESRTNAGSPRAPGVQLVGYNNFVRHNPLSDKFPIHRFHHVEFWTLDATNTYKRFQHGLGMTLVAKSDLSTGNSTYASYVLQSNELVFAFTAPYSKQVAHNSTCVPLPHYSQQQAVDFVAAHGLAVRAVAVTVDDAATAYHTAVANGAIGALPPTQLHNKATGAHQVMSEVVLYGDVVLRFVSGDFKGPYLAGYDAVSDAPRISYGLMRLDHAVGNVPRLAPAAAYIMGFTGFHEFAEFVSEDVGTLDSGLNSVVLANNNEFVLLPVNEPTFGTPRKSQIQTFLEQNEGAGLQHLALKTDDIFATLREMQARSEYGGLEFMPRPSDKYYRTLPAKVGDSLTPDELREAEALGVLVDRDDQGVLLQIFTKPLGDRPTVFIEIIQRLGCMREVGAAAHGASTTEPPSQSAETAAAAAPGGAGAEDASARAYEQAAGCGGFGKGNFSELFKRIEDYERTLTI